MKKDTIGSPTKIAQKEMDRFEKDGGKVIGKQILKGYLSKNYTEVPGSDKVILKFHDLLFDETFYIHVSLSVLEDAYQDFGKDKPVGVIVSDIMIDDNTLVKNVLWLFFKWAEEYDKTLDKAKE